MRKWKKYASLIIAVTSIMLIGFSTIDSPLLSGKATSARWTAEMLCKAWEEQKNAIQIYSNENDKIRGYKIAAAHARKKMQQNTGAAALVKKEVEEISDFKKEVRKSSKKICSANEEFIEQFLLSLDRL